MALGNGNPKEGDKGSNFNYELKVLQGLEAIAVGLENQSKYKVYTALLTQTGTDDPLDQTSGTFTVGVTYRIGGYIAGDDFSNIGGPGVGVDGQWDGEWFVATGTTPLNYTNGTLIQWNTGAPVATVLENTIGNIWFTYGDVGSYAANSDGLFISNKTTTAFLPNQYIESPGDIYNYNGFVTPPNAVAINSFVNYIPQDSMYGVYASNSIEIRVYN